jgi:hypothetical protein|tara:strand:- start:73 stop:606 length:534 start_codon:yes stop_codon:yes gene_type:complete
MRTLTVRKSSGVNYTTGWHTLTVSNAKYGDFESHKFLDVWFEGYSDNFTMRVYEKLSESGEEFAIGQVFRFANAGIVDGLDGPDENVVVKIDDDASHLVGKELNVFFHKDGEYTRALKQCAPTCFKNIIEEFHENDVEYWKSRAEKYYTDYVLNKTNGTTATSNGTTDTHEAAEIPF